MPQNHVIRGFFKVIALMTAVCLAVPSSASAFSTPSESLPAISLQNSGTFQIPESLGTLDEFKLGRTGKTFVLIQDAHQSFEAQQHIADLIHLLVREHGVKTVFEEGYEGLVPTDDLMNDISDPLVKQRVAYYLMDQLLIGGAEYAHINRFDHVSRLSLPVTRKVAVPRQSLVAGEKKSDLPSVHDEKRATSDERLNFKLIGADKLREHFDSVAWYSKAARVQAQVDRDLSSANKELERLIPRFVSKPMRRLLKAKRAYEIQKIDFIAYLREIAGLAIEQTGGISFSVDYPGLANAVRALDSKQAQAIEEVRKLAARDLWRELEQLEAELHHRFLKTDIEKSLIAFYDKINSLKRLNKIEMTASEYERVKSTIAGLHTQELANFIAQHGKNTVVLSREWEEEIRYALGFYETALERDGAVRVAAEAFIKNPDEQIAVLVYGGFHTGRIRETLQSLGATYAIVSPRITRTDKAHEDRYRSLMSADQPGLIDKKTNQLSRPLSAFELMNAGSPERSAIVSQVKVLRAVMSGLPAQRTLSQTVRDAELKLKWRHRHSPTQPGFFSAKSEVRVLEDEIKIADEVLTRAEIELRMEKQGFPELKLLWDTFKTMTVWEGWRLRLMRFEDIDETALSAARVNHMGGWLVRPLLMLILMGSASYLLSAFWSYSVESLVGEGGNLIQALRGVLQEPINVIELGLGAFSIYLGVLWIKRTVISSWKKISALDLARMLSKRSYRQWFDQTEKATAVMSRLETLGVNALWDDVFYRKYYRSAASVVEEVPLPDAHTVHDVLRNVLGQVNAHGYQRGIYTTSLKHGRKTVADFAREHKKEMELSKKGQLAPELGVQLLKRLLTEHLHENSSGYRYVAKAIRNIEVEDYLPDGAVEVRVWERSPWTDLNRAEDFYSSASLRSNQFMDYLKRRSKGMLGSFGYLRNKSISALDFRTKEGRSIRVRMAAVTYKTKAGELRPMLFVDAVEGRLGVKLRLIKKAIEDYAQAAGFDGVFYYKFALNTVPQKFVTYVAEQGVPVEELDIAYVDASERQYLDAFSYVYEPFEYVYPKGKILGHVVDFKEPGMRDPVNPSAAYVFWGKVKKRYARWTLNIAAMGLAGVVLAQNNRQLLLPLGIAAGLTLLYELGLGKKALKRDQTKDVQPRRSEVRAEDFIAAIRRTVESDAYARQMQYAQRFDKKAQKLLVYFPKPTKSLKPFFEEVLLNASIKDTDLENVLKFLNSIKDPEQKESTESLIAVIWPSSDKTLGPIGLSVEKGARDKRRTELFAKLDSVRKFVKAASLSKREIKQVGKLQKKLGLDISHVLDMVSISPTLLRGLKKAPRPIYAWIIPTLLAAAFNTAIFLLFPHISITVPGLVIALGTIIPGTYFVSTQLPIAPGVLYYPKIKKFFRQLIQGDRPVSEINRSLEQLGVRTDEFRKHREYENAAAGVRVVVRDKRQLEDAVKFLTSSEDIDNCIALRNFVAWALPSLLDDDGIVLADLYSKGTSKRYAHRGQMWMMAAEEAGEPVLVVNSFEFNDEGAKYTDVLMPEAINALQDVAQKAGFKKIYTGITEYAREYLDRHYKQGESKNLIRKVHSAREAGFKYQFDVFALTYSLSRKGFTRDYVYQKKRSLTVRAYALIFGLIEFFKGNKAKTRSFWEAAVNPNNFWEIPLVDFTRSEIRSPSDSSPTDDGLGRLKSLRDGGDSTRSEMRASEARTEGRSQGSDAKLPPVLRVTGGAGEIEDFIKKNSRDGAQALADKLVSVELTNNEMGGYQLVFDLVFAPELGRATIQMTRKWDEPTVVREVKFETDDVELRQRHSAEILRLMLLFLQTKHVKDPGREAFQEVEAHITLKQAGGTETSLPGFERLLTGWARDSRHTPYTFNAGTDILRIFLQQLDLSKPARSEVRSSDSTPQKIVTAEQKRITIVKKIRDLNKLLYEAQPPEMTPLFAGDRKTAVAEIASDKPQSKQSLGGDIRSMYLYYALRRAVMGEPPEDQKDADWEKFVPLLLEIATLYPELDPPVELSDFSLKLSSHPEINQVRIRLIKRLRMASMGEEQHESRGSRLHPVLISLLMIALSMGVEEARVEVIRTLPEFRGIPQSERNGYLHLLAAMYQDKRTGIQVKEAILEALGRYGARFDDLHESLIQWVSAIYSQEEENPRLQVAALKAFAQMGDFSEVQKLLSQSDREANHDLIIDFIKTLGSVKTAGAFDFLDSLVGNLEDEELIREVFVALRRQGTMAAYNLLQQKAFDGNTRLRAAALANFEPLAARQAAAIAAAHLSTFAEADDRLKDESLVGEDLIAMLDYLRLKQLTSSSESQNEPPVILNVFTQLQKFRDYQLVFTAAPDLFTLIFSFEEHPNMAVSEMAKRVSKQVSEWLDSTQGKTLVNAAIAIGYLSSRTERDLSPEQAALAIDALNTLASFENSLALLHLSPEVICTLAIYHDHSLESIRVAAQRALQRLVDDIRRDTEPAELSADEVYRSRIFEEFKALKAGDADGVRVVRNLQKILESMIPANGEVSPADDEKMRTWIPEIALKLRDPEVAGYFLNKADFSIQTLPRLIELQPAAFNESVLLRNLVRLTIQAVLSDAAKDKELVSSGYVIQTIAEAIEKQGLVFPKGIYTQLKGQEEGLVKNLIHGVLKEWPAPDPERAGRLLERIGTAPLRFDQQLRWIRWMGGVGTALYAVLAFYFLAPVYPSYFLLVFAEGWGIVALTLWAGKYKGRFWTQLGTMTLGMAGLHGLFHHGMPMILPDLIYGPPVALGALLESIMIRSASVYISAWGAEEIERWFFKTKPTEPVSVRHQRYSKWSLAIGAASGYYIFDVALPFFEKATQSSTISGLGDMASTAFLRSAIDLGLASWITHTGLMIVLGGVFGEGQNVLRDFKKLYNPFLFFRTETGKKFILLIPLSFVIWVVPLFLLWYQFSGVNAGMKVFMVLVGTLWGFALKFVVGGSSILPNLDPIRTEARFEGINITFVVPEAGDVFKFGDLIQLTGAPAVAHEAALKIENRFPDYERLGSAPIPGQGNTIFLRRAAKRSEMRTTPQEADLRGFVNAFLNLTITKLKDRGIIFGMRKHLKTLYAQEEWRRRFVETELGGLDAAGKQKVMQSLLQTDGLQDFLVQLARWIGYTDQDSGIIKSPEFTALLYQALFLGEDAPLEYDGETKHFRLRGLSSRRFTSEDAKRYEESGQWRGVQIVVREPGATDDFEKGDFIEIMGPGADVARASHRILGDFKNYEYSFFTADATAQGRSKMGLKRKGVKVLDEAASHFDDFESVTSPSSASSDTKFEELLQDIERSLVEDGQEATEVRFVTKHDRTHHIQVTYARQPSADKKIQAAILDIRIFAPSQKMVITGQSDLSEAILGEVLAQLRARGISTNQMSEVKFSAKHEISLAGDDWGETQKQVMDVLRYVRLLLWQHLYASSGDASFKTRPLDGINNTPKFPVPSAEALIRFYDAFGTDGWKRLPGIPQRGGIPIGMMNLSPDIQKWYLNLIRGFGRNLKILSLGAGHGELEVALQNTGQQVTAVELSPKNGAILNAKNIKTIVGDANRKLDLPSDFDLVIFIDSIGQMNPRLALENAKDYLRPGGHIFMTTPTTDKPMTKQDYDNTLLVRYPLAYLQQILEMQGLDQLVQGYVPLSNANRASPQAFLQYISAHKPLETRSEVRADADASAHQTSAELEVQSGSARDHAEYAEFMREIKGKPMPLREKSYRESTPYQDLHVDLLLSDLKQADSRSRWQYGSATDKPKAAEPLSEYFDPSVEINFYGKKWRPKVAEINKRSKAPSRSASDIEQMHAYIRAALPIVKEEGGELEETLMSFYEAVRAYTYYWREFSKLKKDPKETRAAATAPSGSMWDEVSIDAWERQHDFYTSQHRHKAVFYFWRVIQTLDRVQRILEKPAYRDQIQHIPLAHAIRKISASSAVTQVRTYFNAYPPSEEDVPAVHPLVKVKRDSFSTRPTETAYRGWFREAANRRFKQGHSGFFYGDRNIKPLSPFWTLISGLHETGAELEFKPGELEEPELQARAQAFKALEDSLWDEDFGQRQRDVQNTFKRLKKPLEKLEFALGAARMIQESGYSLPEILREPGAIHLKKAWNPVAGSKSNMDLFDVDMDQDHNLYAVTGSNEIGKSTHVEMLGVIAFYSQIGLPVPAAAASMSLFRNVYTLVPSMQGVDVGESQHTGFIKQVKDLIKRVKSRDLVLIDEGHMGSDYKDLVGLTEVLMEDLLMTRATVGYATHLKDVPRRLAQKHSEVLLRRLMMRSENGWRWHRNLEEGVARLSGAVDTLRKTGYPQTILDSFESYFRALILEQPLVPTPLQELEPVRDRLRRRSGSSYDAKEDENILNQAMHSVYPSDYFSRGGYFYTLSQMARDELEKGVKPWSGVDAETIQGWAQKLYPQSMSYWDIEKVSIGAVGHDEFEIWAARLNAVREKLLYQNDQAQKALAEVMGRGLFDGASLQRELQTQRQAFEALSFSAKDFWDPDKPGHYKTAAEAREDSQSRAFHLFSDRFPKRLEDPSWDTLDVFMGVSLAVKAQGLKTAVEVQGGETFEIRNAKSPLMPGAVEVSLAGDAEHPQFVILGANKSGKTSLIRTVQALILLARKGLPVPAEMRIPAYEKILTFFGASESMTEGKSYFRMVSERLLSILNNATPNSMVIMDEIHGSDYWELSALQAAILKYLHDIGATVILNTHMREGLALAKDIPSLKFFKTDVARAEDGTLHFSYKVLEDPEITSQSFGIESVKDHLTSEQYQRALKIRNDLALEMAERKKRAAEYRELIAAVAALPEDTALRKILEQSKGMEIENVVEEYQQLFSGQEILQHKVADLVDQPEQWEPLFVAPVQKALLALKQPGDHDDLELDLKKILTLAKLREWILLGHEDSIQLLMTMRSEVRSRSISGTRSPSLALARAEVRTMAASSDEEMFRQLETLFSESNLSLDQLQSRLRSILPPAAQVTLTEKYFYANRKKIPNADRFFKMLFDYLSQHETIGNQRMIRVQDFNFKDAQVGAANIAYAQTPMAVRDKAYQMLTPAEREVMFGEFLSRLKANPKVFHIDHHYDFPVLASTSTTVLLIDFLLYLHAQQEEALIGALHTRSFALMDHADADILLSHFVMEHANDADFLQANQKILSATVLFNDYLVMPQDAAVQSAMLIFYYTFLAIEENVVSGVWTYDEGLRKAGLALAFGLRMAQTQSAAQLYTTLQANRDRHAQETEKEFAALFFRGAKRDFDNRAVLQNMVNLGNFDSTDLVPGMVRKMGPILFFYVADDEPKEIWSSSAYQYLLTERPDLLKGISAIVVSTPVSAAESTSGKPARLFKIRTFMDEDGHFLNLSEPFWKGLREQGYKEAGGRGMAGSLSKSPIENADMSKAVRAYSSAIERLLLLEAVPDEIHSDVARTAILQAVRHKPDGIVARIVAAIPHLYTAEALGGQGLTATTVLQQLNAKKKYALRLGWDRGARLLSLVEDDGFYIGINNEPQTWIDIDKPIWTERVSAKHPWWPLVDALIAGLRPDQQRLINEQVGYGPRLAALYASARSEVRTIVGDHFADEDASYRQWENDFENARSLKGAVLQAALERQKASVRAFVKHYGQTRRKIRTLLERYGFRKSTGQNGVYEFVISDEAQVRLDGDNLKLNSDQVDFLRLDVLQAAVKIIMQHRHYVPADLPRGEGQDQAYMEKSIFSFWNFVSGKLSDLFRPLNNDDKEITWGQLRTLVMDLWTSIQVLQDIQSAPLNEYHERHKIARLFPVNSILASGLSKAAFEASLKNLFTKQDGLVLKQLQLDLERLHFQTAKTLIEFERSLGGQRSEMRVGAVDAFAQPRHLPKVAMIDLNDVVTFSSEEIRETAIVMKQRPEVRFVIYDADPAQANLIHFKRLFSFRNVDWTQSSGEEAYQALGPKFKEGKVVSFSRGDEEGGNVFSAPSRKKIRQFKLSPKKTGTMAVALSFDPEDPRYHWGILREGDFYVVADALASLAVNFLNQFVVAISA